jgi:hypothetical protein
LRERLQDVLGQSALDLLRLHDVRERYERPDQLLKALDLFVISARDQETFSFSVSVISKSRYMDLKLDSLRAASLRS